MSRLRRKHKKSNIIIKILIVFIVIILISSITSFVTFSGLSLMAAGVILDFFSDLPDLADCSPTENALTSRIYADDGTLIATFHG